MPLACGIDVTVNRLTCWLGRLEPDRLASLPLPHRCSIQSLSVRSNVLHLQTDHIAAAQLAVDRQVEHGQVACPPFELQLGADRPDMLWPERRLRSDQLAFIPRRWFRRGVVGGFVVLHGRSPLLHGATSMVHLIEIVSGFGSLLPWGDDPYPPLLAVFDPLRTRSVHRGISRTSLSLPQLQAYPA
jgi:hypothetical protein